MRASRLVQSSLLSAPLLVLAFFFALPASLQAQDDADSEFEFMSGLVEWKMADYAEKALEKLLVKRPDLKERAKVIEAQILISRRKFDEAETLAKTLPAGNPKADTIALAIANGYYRIGELDKAKALYESFFAKFGNRPPEDPDLRRFFQESAYAYAQMLEQAGDREGAAKAYDRVLQTAPGREVARPLMAEQAQLYVSLAREASGAKKEEFLKRVKKLVTDLQWGGIDIWFGNSIVTMANAELARGDQRAAEKFLSENMDILKQIDATLKENNLSLAISPMAGARYLRAEIYEDQGNALEKGEKKKEAQDLLIKAFKEFYNVFAQYGESDWGPKAGVKANALKTRLEDDYGRQINVKLPGGSRKVKIGPQQYRLADTLFRQKHYPEAVEEYLKVLNQFPESDQTPRALSNVIKAYAEMGEHLYARTVIEYLGDRFGGNDAAATSLLLAGKVYFDAKDEEMYTYAYETFLKDFPQHERAGAILFTLAGLRKKAGDEEGRMQYLEQLINEHKNDKYYPRALKMLAWDSYLGENFERSVAGFETYVAEAQPGPDKAKAQFALADSHMRLQEYIQAVKEYNKLIQWLDPQQANNPFNTSAEAIKENASILEKAKFQIANGFSLIKAPPEKAPAIQGKALESFDDFLATYPNSELASLAMAGKGRLLLAMGQFAKATEAFNTLAQKYPNTEEGKNALFSLIKAAMEVEKVDIARDAFGKMLNNASEYGPAEFARVGQLMLDVGANEEAIKAYKQIQGSTEERALLERALFGLGQAYFNLDDFANSIAPIKELMERYPQSGLFYEAKFILAEALLKTGQFDEAVAALGDIFRYAKDEVTRVKSNYRLGVIQKEAGDSEQAYAAFQRVALLSDPANKELRPYIEKCLLESIELGPQLERWQDVVESCDQYLQTFPKSDKIEEVRRSKRDAQLKAATEPAPAAATGEGAP